MSSPTPPETMARLIKRYGNRKLYDTETSAYISLTDVARLVRQGETVNVVDNTTGDDLTAQILTQIILDEGKRGTLTLSSDALHALLRRSSSMIDSGVEHVRQTVDDLVQTSLGRVNQLLHGSQTSDLTQLRDQLGHLEQLLNKVLTDRDRSGSEDEAS